VEWDNKMARGRLLKTKVREAKKIAEAIKMGEDRAQKNKGWQISFREHVGRMIDRIDPLEATAILGMTYVVHSASEYLFQQWSAVGSEDFFAYLIRQLTPWEEIKILEWAKARGDFQLLTWLASFAVAYILVRHGAQIMQTGFNLASFLSSIFGFKV